MRTLVHAVAMAVAAACVTFGAIGAASAAPAANGVFFVHGTGDYCPPSSAASATTASGKTACGYTTSGAVDDYWTADSLRKMSKAPDGTQWSYGVAGYKGASQNAQTSWGTVADQLYDYYYSGNNGAIYNVVVVTHSNGSNPIRYLLAHPTATTPKGRSAQSVINVIKKVVFLAGDNKGTPLADKVTSSGSIAAIGNSILSFFGGSSWNNPAVNQQIQANMATYNGNGTFATGSSPGGVAAASIYGSNVYALVFSTDANCGGYATTTGLKAALWYGWGAYSACSDGFIGCESANYVGTNPYGGDARLNHNQSRRSCHGADTRTSAQIHGAMGGTFAAIPEDYTIAPAAQACNATTQGWTGTPGTSNYTYWYGCTSSMQSDANTDHDCFAAYGGDNGLVAPADFASTAYSNSSYYAAGECSDSWMGDGTCDLCLLAKYGFDAANGGNGPDDCVNKGAGTTNTCYDVAYDGYNSKIAYLKYTATH